MMIDITKPLELSDGTPCYYKGTFDNDIIEVLSESGNFWHFYKNGVCTEPYLKLTLRNVKEAPKMENDLAARMEKLVRRMVTTTRHLPGGYIDEARAIVAELDGPKTDEEWARQIAMQESKQTGKNAEAFLNGRNDNGFGVRIAKAAIAKGRELERMGIDRQLRKGTKFE